MTYYFSDLHGNTTLLIRKIRELAASKCNTLNYFIVLGDHGLNFYLDERDTNLKEELEEQIQNANLNIKIIFIRGNHDVHCQKIYTYEKVEMFGGNVFIEKNFPNLIFLDEADVYSIDGKNYIVYSGGHSRDWFQRILRDEYWSSDEQINDVDHKKILTLYSEKIEKSKKYCLLGHQLPRELSPRESENEMEVQTERHLQDIVDNYGSLISEIRSGHYHINKHWKYKERDVYVHYSK